MTPRPPFKMSSRWGLVFSILSFALTIALVIHLTVQRIASRTQGDKESINSEPLVSAISDSQLNLHVKNDDQVVRTVTGIPSSKSSIVEKNIPKQFEDQWKNVAETNNPIDDFNKWSRQYLRHNCDQSTKDQICDHQDPRALRQFLSIGEKLALARKNEMSHLIREDPEKALSLAIKPEVIEKFPPQISSHLEKWESELVDLQTIHGCSLENHSLCEIEMFSKFSDGRNLRTWTYGDRKTPATISGISAWGISLGGEFAMSDSPIQEISEEGESAGKLLFGGKELTYNTATEKHYFGELMEDTERRARRNSHGLNYSLIMGSDGSVSSFLRLKYEIYSKPTSFDDAFKAAKEGAKTNLLKIETQAENDYLVELLEKYLKPLTDPRVWMGATRAKDANGTDFDHRNNVRRALEPLGVSGGNWFWLDGSQVPTFGLGGFNRGLVTVTAPVPDDNYSVFNWVSGDWEKVFKIDPISEAANQFPYVLEKELEDLAMDWRPIPADLKGVRKVLVVPARISSMETLETDNYSRSGSDPNVNALGEPIDRDTHSDPFRLIEPADIHDAMNEVSEYFLRNSDQSLDLIPVIAPTVTVERGAMYFDHVPQYDSDGNLTAGVVWFYANISEINLAREIVKESASQSEDWDPYGPAFVGVSNISMIPTASLGTTYNPANPPSVTIEGGHFINPVTLLPHVKFSPAKLEAILSNEGRITGVKILDPGAYYFDRHFGRQWDSRGRSIFDYNYTEDDLRTNDLNRSALYEFRDLCQKLDSDNDGVADYSPPILKIDGVDETSSFDLSIENICVSWVALSSGALDGKPGVAHYGSPGVHIRARDGQISSNIIAHEIGHNFGLLHEQRYNSHGEHIISDEGEKLARGNPYSVMGNAQEITNGSGDLSIASKVFLQELFDGGAGFSQGLSQGSDILEINQSADLTASDFEETDPSGVRNKFRIYRANSASPPLSLRADTFDLNFSAGLKDFLDSTLGVFDPGTGVITTASASGKSAQVKIIGEGHDAEAEVQFSSSANPKLIISRGGMGFVTEPTLQILNDNNESILTIDPSSIIEESTTHPNQPIAKLLDSEKWIRGIRVRADSGIAPSGIDVDKPWGQYFLSFRTDISSKGMVLYASNDPDPQGSYSDSREHFMTKKEPFLLDCKPDNNITTDVALLIGSTYSDYESDVHFTPVSVGGTIDLDDMVVEIAELEKKVSSLTMSEDTLRQSITSAQDRLTELAGEITTAESALEAREQVLQTLEALNLDDLEEVEEVRRDVQILRAALILAENERNQTTLLKQDLEAELDSTIDEIALVRTELRALQADFQKQQESIYPYLEVVVHKETKALAKAPEFELLVSNDSPEVGEKIHFFASVDDGNTSAYAYSWFIDELRLSDLSQLNQPSISYDFSSSGEYVLRVVVSDMKGGVASRNVIIRVGDYSHLGLSTINGSVRSGHGSLQGARVVIEQAPTINHSVTLAGSMEDSYFPDGLDNPASFMIDGKVAPEIDVHRGEVHRFYFDKSLEGLPMTFLEKPENTPPRFQINMIADPRPYLTGGSGYLRNPKIAYTTRSAFSAYETNKTGTYLEMLEFLWRDYNNSGNPPPIDEMNETTGGQLDLLIYQNGQKRVEFDQLNSITQPYAKALMKEANVSTARTGPMEINEAGFYIYGGRGYDRETTPIVKVRRNSIWEDYTKDNATAVAKIDGVGTISSIISSTFMGDSWVTRTGGYQTEAPEVVVWGSGGGDPSDPDSEVNASVLVLADNVRQIRISNQGKGFEPNSTMAVLHYPLDPYAYWSFDRHETLFEDKEKSRYQPSPAWNREISAESLVHYWKMDENSSNQQIQDHGFGGVDLLSSSDFAAGDFSQWGLLGNATLVSGTLSATLSVDENFTLSLWIRQPNANLTPLEVGDVTLTYDFGFDEYTFGGDMDLSPKVENYWTHIAIKCTEKKGDLYVDGRIKQANKDITNPLTTLVINSPAVVDEIKVYNVSLSHRRIKYLAGRNFLDLSGNKLHLISSSTGTGKEWELEEPGTNLSSNDTPSEPNPSGSGKLGDSFAGEENGHSINFEDAQDELYLSLRHHKSAFSSIAEGTITLWVKTTQPNVPLFSMSVPYVAAPVEENSSTFEVVSPGSRFAIELVDGKPQFFGFRANQEINDGEWHHLAMSFPLGNLWIDGIPTGASPAISTGFDYEVVNTLSAIQEPEIFAIGRAHTTYTPATLSSTPGISYYEGKIDDFIIYNRSLTNGEVAFLYDLRMGREQIPRLEAVVDAANVEILEGGDGYRENPDLVFWYGSEKNKDDLSESFPNINALEGNFTESNGTNGMLAYVEDEEKVYSFYGNSTKRTYSWRPGSVPTRGWRPLVDAKGIAEFDENNGSVGDVVWMKKMDNLTRIPLPDGRWVERTMIEYVSLDPDLSSGNYTEWSSPVGDWKKIPSWGWEANDTDLEYFKPNGLYGFVDAPDFNETLIESPAVHNKNGSDDQKAEIYSVFYVDNDSEESITIIDQGHGFDALEHNVTNRSPFSPLAFLISGKGFRPGTYVEGTVISTDLNESNVSEGSVSPWRSKEDWSDLNGDPEIVELGSVSSAFNQDHKRQLFYHDVEEIRDLNQSLNLDEKDPYLVRELIINPNETDINKTIGSVSVDSPGHGYSMPIELRVVGGRPSYDHRLEVKEPFGEDELALAVEITNQWIQALGLYAIWPTGQMVVDFGLPLFPQILRGSYTYIDATFRVNFVDENGSLIEGNYSFTGVPDPNAAVEIVAQGEDYIPYFNLAKTDPLAQGSDGKPDPQYHYHFNHYPVVAVSGGGGYGAEIYVREINADGQIVRIEVIDGGRGYFNIDSVNGAPTVRIAHTLQGDEENASLAVQLGGYLKEIPPCNACQNGPHGPGHTQYSHLEPFIEIWDRGRSELEIDELDESRAENNLTRVRAHAVPKVVNGKITKVIVTNSGTGYVDPVAYVRAMPPKHAAYGAGFKRKWRCTYRRMNVDGAYEECNHTHYGSYPPEYCPGETDEQLPYEDINGTVIIPEGTQFESLKQRHDVHVDHQLCTSEHYDGRFIARKCWGTKTSYKLIDNLSYRYLAWADTDDDWLPFNAEVSVISEGGRILEIVVENEGQDYFASSLAVEGSGTGVDAIPVFDEFGVNTQIIFDDPRLKNLDFDKIERPLGAGQGFRERPWSWDDTYDSAFGGREKVRTLTMQSEIITNGTEESYSWTFGDPILADAQGDRVVGIEILDAGIYSSDSVLDADNNFDFIAPTVTIDFNQSCRIEDAAGNKELVDFGQADINLDGYTDFIPASITAHATYRMTRTLLNHSGIFTDREANGNADRGLFLETPIAEFFDGRNVNGKSGNVQYVDEDVSEYIRLNGKVDYDPEEERSYIELFIDDRFPDQFYYGLDAVSGANTRVLPTFGAKIRVTEGLPGMNWAQNEPVKKATHYAYTDQNGYYALTGLSPGIYNVAVFMEDQKFQDSTFRPDGNSTRVSQILYIAGLPELVMETDQTGTGKSSLVWSREARLLSRPIDELSYEEEFDFEYRVDKVLEGVGRGFDPNAPAPKLVLAPAETNLVTTPPNLDVTVLVDGSLRLRILDDENTSAYFPNDRFFVSYRSTVNGLDFVESYRYSESNQTFGSGSLSSDSGGARLVISPGDGNGTNAVVAPLSVLGREWNSTSLDWNYSVHEKPLKLRAFAYQANGSRVASPVVDWKLILEFNASEGNNSRMVVLEDSNGKREQNATGEEVSLYLYSLLRNSLGSILDFEVLEGGANYTDNKPVTLSGNGYGLAANVSVVGGVINDVDLEESGFGYSPSDEITIETITGSGASGAVLKPIFASGTLVVEANTSIGGQQFINRVRIAPSLQETLNSKAYWMNHYLDTFYHEGNDTWWGLDLDDDGLSNLEEWQIFSNPLIKDTDGDELEDNHEEGNQTNPTMQDTDGDGLDDKNETDSLVTAVRHSPILADSDHDGINDFEEYELGSDPMQPDGGIGAFSFVLYDDKTAYEGSFHLQFSTDSEFNGITFSAINADLNGTIFPDYFYRSNLALNETYYVRAFIDLPVNARWDNGNVGLYDEGEPVAYGEVILTDSDPRQFGINLLLKDAPPTIKINDTVIQLENKDHSAWVSNGWGVEANDSGLMMYSSRAPVTIWEVDDDLTAFGYEILLEGNFTQYLTANPPTGTVPDVNWEGLVPGNYSLIYMAEDEWGRTSGTVEQTIEVLDTIGPELNMSAFIPGSLSITGLPGGYYISTDPADPDLTSNNLEKNTTWEWPGGTALNLTTIVRDDWVYDEEPTYELAIMEIATGNLISGVAVNQLGDYNVTLQGIDQAGNEANMSVLVKVIDMEPPALSFADGSPGSIKVFSGEHAILPGIVIDDDFNQSSVYRLTVPAGVAVEKNQTLVSNGAMSWSDSVSINDDFIFYSDTENNYSIEINASDGRNFQILTFLLQVEEPAREVVLAAVDGYLAGSQLLIREPPTVDNLTGEILRTGETNSSGFYTLKIFQSEENTLTDLQDPGDAFGTVDAIGGTDLNTNSTFYGKLRGVLPDESDETSMVVSPLSTLILFLNQRGFSLTQAEQKVAGVFGIDSGINLLNFNPYEPYSGSDVQRIRILGANLRLASMISQIEALLVGMNESATLGQGSDALFGSLAKKVELDTLPQSNQDFELLLSEALDQEIVSEAEIITSSQVETTAVLMEAADRAYINMLADAEGFGDPVDYQVERFIALQSTIDSVIIREIIELAPLGSFYTELADNIGFQLSSSRYRREKNLFAPVGSDFRRSWQEDDFKLGGCIAKIITTDEDGDFVYLSLVSGNFDSDADGVPALKLSNDGKLCVQDTDDIDMVSGKTMRLLIRLEDGRGKQSFIEGILDFSNKTRFASRRINNTTWFESPWMGTFFAGDNGWIYHLSLGWLWGKPDQSGGYWFWDDAWSSWWWCTENAFPWIYRDDSKGWVYLNLEGTDVKEFDYQTKQWRRRR